MNNNPSIKDRFEVGVLLTFSKKKKKNYNNAQIYINILNYAKYAKYVYYR